MSSYTLFVSKRLVTDSGISDGALLVNGKGTIENVLSKQELDRLLADNDGKIEVIDAGDLAVMAGVVDSHVHVNEPGRTDWEGFRTATMAAAFGGITTVVDMPLNSIPPTTTLENLKTKVSAARGNIYCDVGFWGGVIPGNQDYLRDMVDAGVVGFKCFLCPSGVEEFPNVEAADLEKAFEALEGTGSVLAFHAEVVVESTEKPKLGDPKDYNTYLESRPPVMEMNAVSLITSFLPKTDVRVHVVHVSAASVVPVLDQARRARVAGGHNGWRGGVTAETCHHYLTLTADDVPSGHSEYKCSPPIRDKENNAKLWQYLLEEKLDLVVSDHSPCTLDLKSDDHMKAWGGVSSVQFGLSLFWTAASARGLGLQHVTRFLSWGPASLCGLQERKGALRKGCDADIVFFDPEATFLVSADLIRYKNKLSPYLGRELKGIVRKTFLRGNLIYSDGDIVGGPQGNLLLNKDLL